MIKLVIKYIVMRTICKFLLTLLLITIFSIVSCKKPDVDENPELVKSLHSNAKDTVAINSKKYILQAELSRDFMPGYQHKRPLVALIFLVNIDSSAISSNINITRLYVINDQLIWTSDPVDFVDPQVPNFKLGRLSNQGPEWPAGTYVDVVAEVFNDLNKSKYLIITRQQMIQRLDK
jgi:hypothetical protein